MTRPLSLTVNGHPVEAAVEPRTHLADFLRDTLRLTGTHLGCEHGVCGACTVLIDGAPARSCIAWAIACDGAEVRTVEGFGGDPLMQALRDAFARHHALQCGYCTPGMLITAYDIARRLPGADEARVREELAGNLCRCTGYVGIVEAVKSVLADPPAHGAAARAAAPVPSGALPIADSPPGAPERDPSTAPAHDPSVAPEHRLSTTPAHDPSVTPEHRPSTPPAHGPSAAPERHPPAAPEHPPSAASSGSKFESKPRHEITLAVAPDTLWPVLQDVATVVRCLPGASLAGPAHTDPLSFEMAVAIGPMRARFEGAAHVTFDGPRRTGVIEGSGRDTRSRSTGEGRVEFSVQPSRTGGSVLALGLQYTLKGPLAQFSRGAVVDAVVEQLLERFAANVAAAASGENVDPAPPPGGIALALSALWKRLRRWVAGNG